MFPAQLSATEQAGASRSARWSAPSVPIDTLHFMRRNQSDQVIVLHDDEAAASGAQQIFIDEVLQVQEALYGSAVTIHEIGNTAPAQPGHELHLDVAATRGVEQEPTNECQP